MEGPFVCLGSVWAWAPAALATLRFIFVSVLSVNKTIPAEPLEFSLCSRQQMKSRVGALAWVAGQRPVPAALQNWLSCSVNDYPQSTAEKAPRCPLCLGPGCADSGLQRAQQPGVEAKVPEQWLLPWQQQQRCLAYRTQPWFVW